MLIKHEKLYIIMETWEGKCHSNQLHYIDTGWVKFWDNIFTNVNKNFLRSCNGLTSTLGKLNSVLAFKYVNRFILQGLGSSVQFRRLTWSFNWSLDLLFVPFSQLPFLLHLQTNWFTVISSSTLSFLLLPHWWYQITKIKEGGKKTSSVRPAQPACSPALWLALQPPQLLSSQRDCSPLQGITLLSSLNTRLRLGLIPAISGPVLPCKFPVSLTTSTHWVSTSN
jgi:hypothetical protein